MLGARGLHVAIAADVFPKLSETFVLDHVTGLLERGARVTVVAQPQPPGELLHRDAVDLDITVIDRAPVPASIAERVVAVAGAVHSLGVRRLVAAAVRSRREPVGFVRTALEAVALDDLAADVDVVHCHFGPVGASVLGGLREAGRDVPVVTTFHGVDVSTRDDIDVVYAGLFADPRSVLLTVSDRWREVLLSAGADAERTVTHRLGIDMAVHEFTPADRSGGPLRVLSVGRLVEKKGFLDAADGVATAVAAGHDVTWSVIGDGPLRSALQRRVAEPDLRGRVELAGQRTRDDVAAAMRASHVLLAPSRTASNGDMEGIPVVLMEAMASGLPVVSTVHSGIPELVVDGRTGLLVEEGDTAALGRCLGQLATDESRRRRLAIDGRARVEELHDARTQTDLLVERYWSMIDGHSRPT